MRRFDGQVTAAAASSDSPHTFASLGKLGNALVVVGAGFPYYDLAVDLWEGGSWTALGNFTLTSGDWNYIDSYSTVTVEETMYLIGEYTRTKYEI